MFSGGAGAVAVHHSHSQEGLRQHFRQAVQQQRETPSDPSPLRRLTEQLVNKLGLSESEFDIDSLQQTVSDTFLDVAEPIFLELASTAHTSHSASSTAAVPFDPASGLSEPTAECRRLLTDWMAKCAFGPRPV